LKKNKKLRKSRSFSKKLEKILVRVEILVENLLSVANEMRIRKYNAAKVT
jgi:hypothetical protein